MTRLDEALDIFAKRHGIIDTCGDNPTLVMRYLGAGAFSDENWAKTFCLGYERAKEEEEEK